MCPIYVQGSMEKAFYGYEQVKTVKDNIWAIIQPRESMGAYKNHDVFLQMERTNTNLWNNLKSSVNEAVTLLSYH